MAEKSSMKQAKLDWTFYLTCDECGNAKDFIPKPVISVNDEGSRLQALDKFIVICGKCNKGFELHLSVKGLSKTDPGYLFHCGDLMKE